MYYYAKECNWGKNIFQRKTFLSLHFCIFFQSLFYFHPTHFKPIQLSPNKIWAKRWQKQRPATAYLNPKSMLYLYPILELNPTNFFLIFKDLPNFPMLFCMNQLLWNLISSATIFWVFLNLTYPFIISFSLIKAYVNFLYFRVLTQTCLCRM